MRDATTRPVFFVNLSPFFLLHVTSTSNEVREAAGPVPAER